MEKPEARKLGHWMVLVVYPFQGHINPMLQLATILYTKGFPITIAHPQFNSPNHENHPEFHFMATITALNSNCEAPFQQYMEEMMKVEDPHDRVAGVVYDGFMHFAQVVANNLKLPGINVRTSAAATLLLFAVFPDAHHEKCYISFPRTCEFESFNFGVDNSLDESTLIKFKNISHLKFFSLGPFHKLAPSASSSLLKEDTSCISWLDKQAPESVIYISFGSMVRMDEKELVEIAWGLANSEQPFLWVVRPSLVRGNSGDDLLPESFKERVEGRCCIVKWAPQKEVLAHGAVGGFWSHCGWNSTLESVCERVPMLC
ncbi:UDP-glycosyltransferase 76E1-like [Quercus suber]|uniref:UDP-glycosyltransferase 76E1-like n=1 Tax=Quercus suber TaxID=58331 RepID=UPI0032DFF888